jgi:maleamate amidohydrolase
MQVDLSAGRVAVVVTDVQHVFAAPDGPFANTTAGPMIDAINALTAHARTRGLTVIHSRYVLRDDLRDAGLIATMGFDVAPLRTSGDDARIDARVTIDPADVVTDHHRPSAFFDAELAALLHADGADRIVLAGLSVNNAIAATARDAFARDVPCVVVREATGAAPFETAEDAEAGFRALHAWTAAVAPLDEVLARLG